MCESFPSYAIHKPGISLGLSLLKLHLLPPNLPAICKKKLLLYIAFAWQGSGSRWATGVASREKLRKASSVSDRDNSSWLQDGPAADHGRAHQ